MASYCIADPHLNHFNIIRYCDRPFKGVKDMQQYIIKSWNETVKEDTDIVYIVGDLWMGKDRVPTLEKILNQVKGRKILILGNHDVIKPFTYVNHGIESVHTSLLVSPSESGLPCNVYFAHDPAVYTCLPDNAFMVCGHVHGLFKVQKGCANAGVDIWGFGPVSLDILYEVYQEGIKCADITQE